MPKATWQNWSGVVTAHPSTIERPSSEEIVSELVRAAADNASSLRVAGSGHSHAPLVATDDILLCLDRMTGIESIDREARTATIRAGSVLATLGEPLRRHGLAMENLGDIDRQTLAGALATGTHGTGTTLGSLSTQIEAMRLITGDGSLRTLSRDDFPHLLRVARVALGALGVVTAITLRLVPAYRLHERTLREPIQKAVDLFAERAAEHRHCEFFWLPHNDKAEVKIIDVTTAEPDPLCDTPYQRIDHSDRILPSIREERHVEIEYNVPAENGIDAFLAVRECMQKRHSDVLWPVELRTVAADDIPLSPAHERHGMTVSVHQGQGLPFESLFKDVEQLLLDFDGRPHWGKWHTLDASRLSALYPQWEIFHAARRQLDPCGTFLNDTLNSLFGKT